MPSNNRGLLGIAVVVLLIAQAVIQERIADPLRHQYEPGFGNTAAATKGLPIEFALGAVVGFREAVAGLLWVRTDEFFHNGDYEAITPMIRIITWLDPHQVDIYETGAWHMDYNFTDDDQRSDRRYIPLSIALLEEGIQNNPEVPELDSDLAFTHYYRKIGDYVKAKEWFLDGQHKIDGILERYHKDPKDAFNKAQAESVAGNITTLSHGLAHAYEDSGDVPDAVKQWQYCIAAHESNLADNLGTKYGELNSLDTAKRQLYELMARQKYRQDLAKDPVDFGFRALLVRVAPKVFIVHGNLNAIGAKKFKLETGERTWGPINGCRIEIRLQDADYVTPDIKSFSLNSLDLNQNVTVMQDSVSVRGGLFERKIDMSKDPQMYGFKAPKYTLTLWFNPASINDTPINVQDRIGWLGQGLTDKRHLDTSGILPGDIKGHIPGLRYLKKTFTLTRDDILGQGEKAFN